MKFFMVVLETIWNGIKYIISKICELLWFILSKALELIWKLLLSYWYVFLAIIIIIILLWIIIGVIEDRRIEKWRGYSYSKSHSNSHSYSYSYNDSGESIKCEKSLEEAAEIVCDKIERVSYLYCAGGSVCFYVWSQTGQTVWQCIIDFDEDYNGNITGEYSIDSDNDQSSIPEHVAKEILKELQAH